MSFRICDFEGSDKIEIDLQFDIDAFEFKCLFLLDDHFDPRTIDEQHGIDLEDARFTRTEVYDLRRQAMSVAVPQDVHSFILCCSAPITSI